MSKPNMEYSNFVSRNEAINALLKQEQLTPSIIRRVLMQVPGSDVVDVIRCGKCGNSELIASPMGYVYYCSFWQKDTEEDGYCHEGC